MLFAATIIGLSVAAVHIMVALGGAALMFPAMELTVIFIYFMGGLIFYHALAANLVDDGRLSRRGDAAAAAGPGKFGYDACPILAVNLLCASVVYMHEKTSRMRFLEAALLKEMVARDGLTGIQNRRMFDQHIQRTWNQAVRDTQRVAVLLADIDCFKDYNDRYGHQAGDECLRAVAVSLSQCARRPLDFVARYGGEEFAVVLYEASREYVAEVLTRIQRSIAELNIPHEASRVASRLTVSIGAALHSSGRQPHPRGVDPARRRGAVQREGAGQKSRGGDGGRIPDAAHRALRAAQPAQRFGLRRGAARPRPAPRKCGLTRRGRWRLSLLRRALLLARNIPSELNSIAIWPSAIHRDDAAFAAERGQLLEHHFAHRLRRGCARRTASAHRYRAPRPRG